ncbi:hypothetical protein [Fluoribacter gormanii]|nr:hypothetical protein [Fluoribacter gormanii]
MKIGTLSLNKKKGAIVFHLKGKSQAVLISDCSLNDLTGNELELLD